MGPMDGNGPGNENNSPIKAQNRADWENTQLLFACWVFRSRSNGHDRDNAVRLNQDKFTESRPISAYPEVGDIIIA